MAATKTRARTTSRTGSIRRSLGSISSQGIQNIAVIGGVVGAVGLGGYLIWNLIENNPLNKLANQFSVLVTDYFNEADKYAREDSAAGLPGLSAAHTQALAAKRGLLDDLLNTIKQLIAQGITDAAIIGGIFVSGLAFTIFAKYGGLKALGDFIGRIKGEPGISNSLEARSYIQIMDNALSVEYANEGAVALTQFWFHGYTAVESLTFQTEMAFEQQVLTAQLPNLTGLALQEALVNIQSLSTSIEVLVLIRAIISGFGPGL